MNRFKILAPKPGSFKEMSRTHPAALGSIRNLTPSPQSPPRTGEPLCAAEIPSAHLARQAHAERLLTQLLTTHFILTESGTLRARESCPDLSIEFLTYWRSL
jgi:hypothetical protein